MSRALKKPEHGGHVYAVGSGVTVREYFGSNNPTPPSQMRVELNALYGKIEVMQNTQNLLMSYMMNTLNQDQMAQFMAAVGSGQLGGFNGQMSGIGTQLGGSGNQLDGNGNHRLSGANDTSCTSLGHEGILFSQLLTRGVSGSSQQGKGGFVSNVSPMPELIKKDVEPYHVPWPETQEVHHQPHEFPEAELHKLSVLETTPTNIDRSLVRDHTFPLVIFYFSYFYISIIL